MENAQIADRLEALAALLELNDANPYTTRAYRRAAETIRGTALPMAELVRAGRSRELRGIGPGIEARLRELVQTGKIAELAELERELSPELVGLGRYLGLTAKRSVELARSLDVHSAGEFREAAAAGRLRGVPGIGPKTEARLIDALAREGEPRPLQGLLLNQARELVGGVATVLDGEVAGDVRRWRDSCEHLAVVCAATNPEPVLAKFAALAQIVALLERGERRAVGITIEGVPLELVAAAPESFGTAFLRATGSPAYIAALEPLPDAPDERTVYRALKVPWCPPELREQPFRAEPPALVTADQIRGDLHCHTTWSTDARASTKWAAPRGTGATNTWRSATTRPRSAPCVGSTADDVRRQGEEIARGQRAAGAVSRAARDRVRHPARRAARSPRRRPRRARLGAGQRPRRSADAAARR